MPDEQTTDYGQRPARADIRPRLKPWHLLLGLVVGALAIMAAAAVLPGVRVDDFWGALLAALLIAVVNAVVPPLIAALRLPYTVGLAFLLVLVADALALQAVGSIEGGLEVDDFGWALLAALVISAVIDGPAGDHRDERRRRLLAQRRAPGRAEVARPRGHRRPRHPLPRDRRAREARAAAGDARRQRARVGELAGRQHPPPRRMGDRPLLPDGREPGGDPARLEREHSRVPLGREGAHGADGLLEPRRLRRARAAARRRRAPRETAARAAATCSRARPTTPS